MTARTDGRNHDEVRALDFLPGYQLHPLGSVLISLGRTRVLCSVTAEQSVPRWMHQQGVAGGWLTAEYRMLPGATVDRGSRSSERSGTPGRSAEIQRLIGRCLRAVVELDKVGSRTLYVDCDVIDADGGTRCAAITGASVALQIALQKLFLAGEIRTWPMRETVAAVSVGIVGGEPRLDLCYEEDSGAAVDMNVVMTASGKFVELQGSAEEATFSDEELHKMLALARKGLVTIHEAQQQVLQASSGEIG